MSSKITFFLRHDIELVGKFVKHGAVARVLIITENDLFLLKRR